MNVQKMYKALALPAIVCLVLTACKKETGQPATTNEPSTLRNTGLLLPDSAAGSKVPIIASADFLLHKSTKAPGVVSAAKGKPSRGGSSDVTAPVVSITSPSDGASVSGTITVTASASDNTGVSSVNFYVDGALKNTLTASPYQFSWDASSVPDGSHTLTCTAYDAAGNNASSSVTVAVNTTITVIDPPPASFPSSYQVTMPPVGNQGEEFSCVAYATSSVRSSEKYYKMNAGSYSTSTNIFSPEYIYNQVKFGDCYSGTTINRCMDLLQNQGVCTWQTMPYSNTNGCSLLPNSTQTAEAANYKIGSYAMIYPTDITAIKNMLVSNHAMVTGSPIDNDFQHATAGFIWSAFNGSYGNNHGYVLCGYDDAKHAYRVMNSWGTGWGDNGYSWIDYDFFGTISAGVFVMNNAN